MRELQEKLLRVREALARLGERTPVAD